MSTIHQEDNSPFPRFTHISERSDFDMVALRPRQTSCSRRLAARKRKIISRYYIAVLQMPSRSVLQPYRPYRVGVVLFADLSGGLGIPPEGCQLCSKCDHDKLAMDSPLLTHRYCIYCWCRYKRYHCHRCTHRLSNRPWHYLLRHY